MAASDRTKTITWTDPRAAAQSGALLSGLDYIKAMAEGAMPAPPIAVLMNMVAIEVEEGRVVFAGTPGEEHYNPIGLVHGGFAMTLLDSAMGCAVHTTLPIETGYTSLETKVNFVRPLNGANGRVLAAATVTHRGRQLATAEGRITREHDGKLVALGTTTCLIFSRSHATAVA